MACLLRITFGHMNANSKGPIIAATAALAALVVVSFGHWSAACYPFLDSDMAIHVLMAKAFNLWRDYYYWGQSRLGSLLPLMAFVPWKLGADALWAVSAMQYVLAVLTIACVGWLSKDMVATLLFAVLFLLPPAMFEVVLLPGHPYLPQLLLLFMAVAVAGQWNGSMNWLNVAWYLLYWVVALCSAWVSDMGLVTAPIILAWRTFQISEAKIDLRQNPWRWAATPIAASVVTVSVKLLKMGTIDYSGYVGQRAVGPFEAATAIVGQAKALWAVLTNIADGTWVLAAYTALIVVFFGLGAVQMARNIKRNGWAATLASVPGLLYVLALMMWAATLFSGWANVNGYPLRYFIPSIFCLMMASIVLLRDSNRTWVSAHAILVIAMGGLTLIAWQGRKHDHWKYVNSPEARAELREMQSTTLFGAYWFVYAMAAQNANELVPMPIEGEFARNGHQLWQVWETQNFYLCRNGLFDTFPDTLQQYGATFSRADQSEFQVGNAQLARYTPVGNLPKVD